MNYIRKRLFGLSCRIACTKIQNGIVNILLIEGKQEILQFKEIIPLEKIHQRKNSLRKGKISNFKELDRSLTRFNLTNDSPIQVNMTSGKVLGTTDYFLQIYEPKRQQFLLLQIIWDKKYGRIAMGNKLYQ